MSLLVDSPIMGLKQIQRQAFYTLFDNLNPLLDEAELALHDSQSELAIRTGRPSNVTPLENIEPDNFIEGYRPTLIDAPIEEYPNCSVWTTRALPFTSSDDHMETYNVSLFVEIMVKSSPEEGESVATDRAIFSAEAAHVCLLNDKELGGIITDAGQPSANLSGVFTRKERSAYGPHWFWQSARLEYTVRKEASLYAPQTSGSLFRASGLDVDQL